MYLHCFSKQEAAGTGTPDMREPPHKNLQKYAEYLARTLAADCKI